MAEITRETLELAALAAGLKHVNYDGLDYDGRDGLVLVDGIGRHLDDWRPHLDDGDAARLAVRLNMEICMDHGQVAATVGDWHDWERIKHDGTEPDKSRAWREAVVLRAAEVGRRQIGTDQVKAGQ